MVMKMEFDDEADAAADGSEMGLTARLTKKVKKEPAKDKSKTDMYYMKVEEVGCLWTAAFHVVYVSKKIKINLYILTI